MYKVFLADDEPFIIEGLYDIVDWAALGLEIVGHAENGAEALDKLHDVPADILITDISMPVMTGLQLIRSARVFRPELKVIVLSGFDEFAYIKEGLALGIENYLLKPINLEEFRNTLVSVAAKLEAAKAEREWERYSAAVLKDHVLQRWVRGAIGREELAERARLLDLQLEGRYVTAAVLRRREPAEGEDLAGTNASAAQAPETMPPLSAPFTAFRDADDDIVILHLSDDGGEGRLAMEGLLETLRINWPPAEWYGAALGTIQEMGEMDAGASYDQAKRSQDYLAVYPERHLIRYEELEERRHDLRGVLPEDWSELSRRILARDREWLNDTISSLFAGEAAGRMTPELLREAAVEWMVYLRSVLKEVRGGAEPEPAAGIFVSIRRASTVRELGEAILTAVDRLLEMLEGEIKSPVVQQVLARIHAGFNEDLSLKLLGAEFNIHPVYLGQLFHKETGEPFTEYMNRYRIEKAKELLRTTHLKVHEIARSVGYWEPGYFYKQFRKYVGVSPTEFKGLV